MTGVVRPREWQAVAGLQWYVLAHLKVVTEYSRREFTNDKSIPTHERLVQSLSAPSPSDSSKQRR